MLVDRVAPGVWAGTRLVDSGPYQRRTDLSRLLGRERTETVAGVAVHRDGVSVVAVAGHIGPYAVVRSTATSSHAPLVNQPTLILGDSFTEVSMPQLQPLFADLTYVPSGAMKVDLAAVARLVRASPVVVVELVERSVQPAAYPLLSPAVLDALERDLAAAGPAR